MKTKSEKVEKTSFIKKYRLIFAILITLLYTNIFPTEKENDNSPLPWYLDTILVLIYIFIILYLFPEILERFKFLTNIPGIIKYILLFVIAVLYGISIILQFSNATQNIGTVIAQFYLVITTLGVPLYYLYNRSRKK